MLIPFVGHSRVEVLPGGRYATSSAVDIKTLLGSCIAACLYDPVARVAGLNHFLLAAPRYSRTMHFAATDAGRYGIHAMELLILDMEELGARRARLRAKVFGGASMLGLAREERFACVNEVNQRFIRDYLEAERIPVVAENLGGKLGRVIHFHTDSYKVFQRYIRRKETERIAVEEREYWRRAIESPEHREGGPLSS